MKKKKKEKIIKQKIKVQAGEGDCTQFFHPFMGGSFPRPLCCLRLWGREIFVVSFSLIDLRVQGEGGKKMVKIKIQKGGTKGKKRIFLSVSITTVRIDGGASFG